MLGNSLRDSTRDNQIANQTLAANNDLTLAPAHVVELERDDLTGPQSKPREQQ